MDWVFREGEYTPDSASHRGHYAKSTDFLSDFPLIKISVSHNKSYRIFVHVASLSEDFSSIVNPDNKA